MTGSPFGLASSKERSCMAVIFPKSGTRRSSAGACRLEDRDTSDTNIDCGRATSRGIHTREATMLNILRFSLVVSFKLSPNNYTRAQRAWFLERPEQDDW